MMWGTLAVFDIRWKVDKSNGFKASEFSSDIKFFYSTSREVLFTSHVPWLG